MQEFGGWSLIPTALVLLAAVITRNALVALFVGCIAGAVMLEQFGAVALLVSTSLSVISDEDVGWVILVCGLMGCLIGLMIRIGAIDGFSSLVTGFAKSRTSALMSTWVMGLSLFVDDYLNSISVGSAMRKITDGYKTSREMLAYIIDSTAAPISVIIPVSTWAVFFSVLIEDNNLAADGQGIATYISAIPYMFYAWVAVLIVPLVIYKKIPLLGAMRGAESRAIDTGVCVPPEAEHVEKANQAIKAKVGVNTHGSIFVIAMVILVASTWWFDLDFLMGLYITLGCTAVYILVMRLLSVEDLVSSSLDGLKMMIEPLAVLFAAFMLKEINDGLGLTEYAITAISPYLSAKLLPVAIFLVMGFVSFATGSNWGVFVIVLPIVTALGNELNADMIIVIGATLSASTFGSHACFYSDATVLTAQASGCTPFQHALTQLPYALLAAGISCIGYLIVA